MAKRLPPLKSEKPPFKSPTALLVAIACALGVAVCAYIALCALPAKADETELVDHGAERRQIGVSRWPAGMELYAVPKSDTCSVVDAGECAGLHIASIDDPSPDEMLDEIAARKVRESEAQRVLDQAMPTPTPWQKNGLIEVEVLPSGNVWVVHEPRAVVVAGKTPIGFVPLDCRADFKSAPVGTTVICMASEAAAALRRRSTPEENQEDTNAP